MVRCPSSPRPAPDKGGATWKPSPYVSSSLPSSSCSRASRKVVSAIASGASSSDSPSPPAPSCACSTCRTARRRLPTAPSACSAGQVAVVAMCVTYAIAAPRHSPALALGAALVAWVVGVAIARTLVEGVLVTASLHALVALAALAGWPRSDTADTVVPSRSARHDLLVRVAIGSGLVIALTAAVETLGSGLAGTLAAAPSSRSCSRRPPMRSAGRGPCRTSWAGWSGARSGRPPSVSSWPAPQAISEGWPSSSRRRSVSPRSRSSVASIACGHEPARRVRRRRRCRSHGGHVRGPRRRRGSAHLTRRLGRAGPTAAADGLLVNGTPLPAGVLDPAPIFPSRSTSCSWCSSGRSRSSAAQASCGSRVTSTPGRNETLVG